MRVYTFAALYAATLAAPLASQQVATGAASQLSVERIFGRNTDFRSAPLPSVHWLKDGASYVDVRPADGGGVDIVRVNLVTGGTTIMAPASALVDEGGRRIDVEDIQLSDDETKALLFHSSVRVWRTNTRGVYHVVDFTTRKVTPVATITTRTPPPSTRTDTTPDPFLGKRPSFLGRGLQSGAVDSALQMFAKFSPDGRMVAFVRGNDLWVTELASGRTRRLTFDGSDDIINGTTDWVYEEELGLQDAFRWSPDSRRLAFWRFDQSAVQAYPMVDETAGQYPVVSVLRYPKAGTPNSAVRVGVLDVAAGASAADGSAGRGPSDGAVRTPATAPGRVVWMDVGADTGLYIPRLDWLGADSLVVQRMPRRQNRLDLLMLSASTGKGRVITTDRDSAYVDVEGDGSLRWIDNGARFLLRSDRGGWRQVFLFDRAGRMLRQVTRDGADVLSIVDVDAQRGDVYVMAAAPNPTQRQLFRYSIDGTHEPVQVTTGTGSHAVTVGPGARYLVDFHSTAAQPTTVTLYELPSMQAKRVLVDNAALKATLGALAVRPPEFFRIPMPDGTQLDAMRLLPQGFDSTKHYPVLMYVYGGPAAPQVNDAWGGTRYLWHQMLTQKGYAVVIVDNRGAAWRGNAFRKVTQHRLGRVESQDQIDAAKWLARQSWVDGRRVGIWGWSYGGFMAATTAFRGGDVFRAAIAVAPVTDWSFYDTIYTERFMWTPQENAAGYRDNAPLALVNGLTASFLLVHGTGDDNVHPQNTIQLVDRLEAAGKPFQLMLYPNRTHSISGGNTQVHLFDMLTKFVTERL